METENFLFGFVLNLTLAEPEQRLLLSLILRQLLALRNDKRQYRVEGRHAGRSSAANVGWVRQVCKFRGGPGNLSHGVLSAGSTAPEERVASHAYIVTMTEMWKGSTSSTWSRAGSTPCSTQSSSSLLTSRKDAGDESLRRRQESRTRLTKYRPYRKRNATRKTMRRPHRMVETQP